MCSPLTAEPSHLPPLDLRFRGLTGTARAASLLLHQLDICLLAGWGGSGTVVQHEREGIMVEEKVEVKNAK